ncbi:molybdopterin molybdotransferase MoeA [Infirmifilum lucidum]|uniref:Molybdopterin molybdotransferase MoeA n=1 Tax=Infirmifilum lucidum TaxID=2776706 RepID=A0A7L9FHS2_9CREN|nr:molybdopterin molybdotransferase MoeA [Infirmifilum lucidum]QOJ79350.1 molybdopterin molybdotransferase MoeA [Infirmifilum lucidum]
MRELHSVHVVLREVQKYLKPPAEVGVPVESSLGLYSAETVLSTFKLPPRPKSVVDGYALRASDVEPASPSSPVPLRLLEGILRPTVNYPLSIGPGEAVRIETGALLPEGADAAVPLEDTFEEGGRVYVLKRVSVYENVSLPGEEYDEGLTIIRRGERVKPQSIAGLILEGRSRIKVFDTSVRILNVGDEIVSGTFFRPFTHFFVKSWFEQHGFRVEGLSLARDDVGEIREWLEGGEAYISVLLGGTSMGGHDFTVKALESLDPEYIVHGFAVQPGKTACLAVREGRPIVAMSGLPVAAMSTLEVVVKPLLRSLGLEVPEYPKVKAVLTRRVTVKMGVVGFVRVRVYRCGGGLCAEPLMVGGSGSLTSLLRGNGFVVVPEGVEGYEEGEEVEVYLYRGVE